MLGLGQNGAIADLEAIPARAGELALQPRDLLLERVDPDTDVATLAERA